VDLEDSVLLDCDVALWFAVSDERVVQLRHQHNRVCYLASIWWFWRSVCLHRLVWFWERSCLWHCFVCVLHYHCTLNDNVDLEDSVLLDCDVALRFALSDEWLVQLWYEHNRVCYLASIWWFWRSVCLHGLVWYGKCSSVWNSFDCDVYY